MQLLLAAWKHLQRPVVGPMHKSKSKQSPVRGVSPNECSVEPVAWAPVAPRLSHALSTPPISSSEEPAPLTRPSQPGARISGHQGKGTSGRWKTRRPLLRAPLGLCDFWGGPTHSEAAGGVAFLRGQTHREVPRYHLEWGTGERGCKVGS